MITTPKSRVSFSSIVRKTKLATGAFVLGFACTVGVTAAPITDNLAAYYKFDGDALDSTGNTTGAFTNSGALQGTGFIGGSADVTGTADTFDISGVTFGSNSFSIQAWYTSFGHNTGARPWGNNVSGQGVNASVLGNGNWGFNANDGTNSTPANNYLDDHFSQLSNNNSGPANRWIWSLTVVDRTADTVTHYGGNTNGIAMVTNGPFDISALTGSLDSGNPFFLSNGARFDFDEVAIWDAALTAADAAVLYNGGAGFEDLILPGVPEPSTFALATLGLLSLSFAGWRRRRR